jgi:hypothetical protein
MMVDQERAGDALGALGEAGAGAMVVGRVEAGRHGVELAGPEFWAAPDNASGSTGGTGPRA